MLIEEIAERFLGPCVPASEVAERLRLPEGFLVSQIGSHGVPGGSFAGEWFIPKEWADFAASPAGRAAFDLGYSWGKDD